MTAAVKPFGESSAAFTDYLKGLAILIVMANHYHNSYFNVGLAGYAHGVISLFFVLSGYGIYHSLARRDATAGNGAATFFVKRFLRIYSLYWLYLFSWFLRGQDFSVARLAAIDSAGAWFVTAILLCYVVAIPLFRLLGRVRLSHYVAAVCILVALVHVGWNALNLAAPGGISEYAVRYRGVNFGYLGIFALGLALPKLLERLESLPLRFPRLSLLLAGLIFSATIHCSQTSRFLCGALLVLSSAAFVALFLMTRPGLPLKRGMATLGRHSYSLYLFHMLYYEALHRVGIIDQYSAGSVLVTLLLFPLFLQGCRILDTGINRLLLHLDLRGRTPARTG